MAPDKARCPAAATAPRHVTAVHHERDHRERRNVEDDLNTVQEEDVEDDDDDDEKDDATKGDGDGEQRRLVERDRTRIEWTTTTSTTPDDATAAAVSGRRASYEHQRPGRVRELRRCRSEVSAPSGPATPAAATPAANQNNPLAAKDKIQALARTARELRTLKLHYYPESGWGWVILLCACVTHCVCYGLLLAAGTLGPPAVRRYGRAAASVAAPSSTLSSLTSQNLLVRPFSTDAGLGSTRYRSLIAPSDGGPAASHQFTTAAGALAGLSLCCASLLSPVVVAWCRRKSTRLTAVFGGLVAALGLLFTSFASQFHQLFLSYGLVLGIGVGLTRETATLMVGQYFKRRREAVEIALVGASGAGLAVMTVLLHSTLSAIGWRLGLQAVTGLVLVTFILGSFYRSASLYHPQRRAILHLKNQRKKIKEKNKREDKPPFFDFTSLHSRTIQTIMASSALIAAGLYTPLIYMGFDSQKELGRDACMWFQVYVGLAWTLGCAIVGLLIVREPAECKIGRQYLCQAAGLLTGLALLAHAIVSSPHEASSSARLSSASSYGLFCWVYGFGLGAYHYTLKMFVYQRVRARNFARAWSFVQASQAIALVCGIPFAGFLLSEFGQSAAYFASSAFVLAGSLTLLVIDLRKYVFARSHSHKHKHHHRKKGAGGAQRPRTPRVASEPNTDGGGGASGASAGIGGREPGHADFEAEEEDVCPPSCKGRNRRDSLAEEEVHLPPLTLLQQTSLVLAQLGELPCGAAAAELTCISEEGIADMDIPDHLLEELDFAADCITSCDKVENYLMLSEYENNLIQHSAFTNSGERKSRKTSIFRQIGQTFGGRHAPKSNVAETGFSQTHSDACQNGGRRNASNHARIDASAKLTQIHESGEAEGRV